MKTQENVSYVTNRKKEEESNRDSIDFDELQLQINREVYRTFRKEEEESVVVLLPVERRRKACRRGW